MSRERAVAKRGQKRIETRGACCFVTHTRTLRARAVLLRASVVAAADVVELVLVVQVVGEPHRCEPLLGQAALQEGYASAHAGQAVHPAGDLAAAKDLFVCVCERLEIKTKQSATTIVCTAHAGDAPCMCIKL